MTPYTRYPPPSGHRTVWILIAVLALVLLANLANHGGIG